MLKEIICVYQDCVMCGDRGKELKQYIDTNGLNVRKVSFACEEGKELVHSAVFEHKITQMPFFTDGTKFTTKISELVEKKETTAKKTRKKIKEGKNGSTR